jgi:hypothetical protein
MKLINLSHDVQLTQQLTMIEFVGFSSCATCLSTLRVPYKHCSDPLAGDQDTDFITGKKNVCFFLISLV